MPPTDQAPAPKSVVLVIDDDRDYRALVRYHLETAGYFVLELSAGTQAADVLSRHSVQLVILDLVMPDHEGIETILELRRKGFRTKILAISGAGGAEQYLKLAAHMGADACLQKNRPIEGLLAKVAQLTRDMAEASQ
jgi:DNA-binding response OmpR family regulator